MSPNIKISPDLSLIESRYGEIPFRVDVELNACLTTLLSHRSIRTYQPDPLPPGTLELLIAAAQSASTSCNLQTWSVIAVQDQARRARLAELAGNQAYIAQCPLLLVWLADLARLTQMAQNRDLPHEGLDYLEMFLMAVIDASLAAQNAVAAAESLGLGTVYIGAMRNRPEDVAAELGLPEQVFTVFGLCVGYPDPVAPPASIKPRLPQAAVLHHETYNLEQQDAAVSHYNQIMANFYSQQQMKVQGDWSSHSLHRVASGAALMGRDRLRQALNQLGFNLY